ncbi:uncharacterized protein DSM5745_09483 [Aspergillus mulundensis]|uniref:Uncharacterized protein n=1 Tax=Aspergillus mulundensis TaxID=1810919 RepID=A0A3D8QW50_9EURO|nr:hypothetical protein DSM5745_09483 [Aspergillus mulundensis]RDW65744.1 hypothetical protein DSM5745_09483 [Aspergillus mulundensis]
MRVEKFNLSLHWFYPSNIDMAHLDDPAFHAVWSSLKEFSFESRLIEPDELPDLPDRYAPDNDFDYDRQQDSPQIERQDRPAEYLVRLLSLANNLESLTLKYCDAGLVLDGLVSDEHPHHFQLKSLSLLPFTRLNGTRSFTLLDSLDSLTKLLVRHHRTLEHITLKKIQVFHKGYSHLLQGLCDKGLPALGSLHFEHLVAGGGDGDLNNYAGLTFPDWPEGVDTVDKARGISFNHQLTHEPYTPCLQSILYIWGPGTANALRELERMAVLSRY